MHLQKLLILLESSPDAQQTVMNAVNNDNVLLTYVKQLLQMSGITTEAFRIVLHIVLDRFATGLFLTFDQHLNVDR